MGKKIWKYNKSTVIIFLVCVILSVPCLAVIRHFRVRPAEGLLTKAEDYYSVIADEADKPGKFVYVKIADVPYLVAEETTEHSEYYIVFDEDDYMYVALLTKSTYNAICNAYENDPDDFTYTVAGMTEETDEDLRDIIIEIFNETYDDLSLDSSNYENYFGATYLNESTLTPHKTTVAVAELCLIAAAIVGVLNLLVIIKGLINTKRSLKTADKAELEDELSQVRVIEYPKAKILLLNRYFVSMNVGMIANRYSDIAWVYVSNNAKTKLGFNYRSIAGKQNMVVHLKSGKKYTTATAAEDYTAIIEDLVKRNPNIMTGYSYENLSNYKKIINLSK